MYLVKVFSSSRYIKKTNGKVPNCGHNEQWAPLNKRHFYLGQPDLKEISYKKAFNPLSANPTKWSITIV